MSRNAGKDRAALTFDTDWSCDEVLLDTAEILSEYGVRGTFFCTGDSPGVQKLQTLGHEIALHPNLVPLLNNQGKGGFKEVISELHSQLPGAVGVRFHSLVTASPVLDFCRERGLTYDSSLRLPEIVEPFRESRGILRVPFELSDAQILYDRDEIDPKDAEVRARVYAFHPQLVFLNCELLARYNDTKPVYRDYAALKAARNMGPRFGARDLLKRVIEFRSPQAFSPLREVVAHA